MAPAAALSSLGMIDSVCDGARMKAMEFLCAGCGCNAEESNYEEADIVLSEGVPLNDVSNMPVPWIHGDDVVSMEAEQSMEDSGSLSAASESSSVGCPLDDLLLDIELISRSSAVVVDGVEGGASAASASDSAGMGICVPDLGELVDVCQTVPGSMCRRNPLVSECAPLWGSMSVCGRRPEMEDAANAILRFSEIPPQLLTVKDSSESSSGQRSVPLMAHFFGVYDGHGGAQVASYCKERVHGALIEEFRNHALVEGSSRDDMCKQWARVFTGCFNKVDTEVSGERTHTSCNGSVGQFDAVAPETVGSTAVVAVVCSSHIVVANCGDSRAVLSRGKQPRPLSSDHKPNREDEYARIEAAGGKVIQWNGYRVLGVLAMSRSIGDRYLKPWVISEPEVTCVPRTKEDECLILASDGLWDVLSNEEVCETARKRIQLWHKKNGGNPLEERSDGANPAAQAAADYLTKLALHRGSKDNVTVIVIDLKAQWKFKTRTR